MQFGSSAAHRVGRNFRYRDKAVGVCVASYKLYAVKLAAEVIDKINNLGTNDKHLTVIGQAVT